MAGTAPKEAEISIKIMMQKDKNRVIFAEADNNFVDILFSFMTLPLGTIVRILEGCPDKKDTVIPGLKNLYESLKDLPAHYFSTDESKYILLNPRSSAHDLCRKLKINIDDTEPLKYFTCQCSLYSEYSLCNLAKCGKCGNTMGQETKFENSTAKTGGNDQVNSGVFVSEVTTFIVTDDLRVMPNTSDSCVPLLCDLGITDASQLEERTFDVGRDQILVILKGVLLSDFSLTQLVFPKTQFRRDLGSTMIQPLMKNEAGTESKRFTLNIRLQKSTSKFLFAEAAEDFVDFVFGFLGISLGVVVGKLMNGTTSLGCLDNLFASISSIGINRCFKSQDVKNMVCDNGFLQKYLSRNQIFPLKVLTDSTLYLHRYYRETPYYYFVTYLDRSSCSGGRPKENVRSLSLKDPRVENRFLKAPAMFMLMDDLRVTPSSSLSTIALLKKLNVPLNDVENLEISIGIEEGLKLLKACLMSSVKCWSPMIDSLLKGNGLK